MFDECDFLKASKRYSKLSESTSQWLKCVDVSRIHGVLLLEPERARLN